MELNKVHFLASILDHILQFINSEKFIRKRPKAPVMWEGAPFFRKQHFVVIVERLIRREGPEFDVNRPLRVLYYLSYMGLAYGWGAQHIGLTHLALSFKLFSLAWVSYVPLTRALNFCKSGIVKDKFIKICDMKLEIGIRWRVVHLRLRNVNTWSTHSCFQLTYFGYSVYQHVNQLFSAVLYSRAWSPKPATVLFKDPAACCPNRNWLFSLSASYLEASPDQFCFQQFLDG